MIAANKAARAPKRRKRRRSREAAEKHHQQPKKRRKKKRHAAPPAKARKKRRRKKAHLTQRRTKRHSVTHTGTRKRGKKRKTTMAKKKRKHGGRKKRRSAAQKAASRRNIRKAQRASRRGKRRGGGRRRGKKHGRKGYRKGRTIRRPRGRKHWPRKVKRIRRRGRVRAIRVTEAHGRKRRRRRGRRAHALENPLDGMELASLTVAAVAGIVIGDFIDRYIATSTSETAGSGSMLATLAPPDIKRIGIGLAAAAAPIVGAHFVKMSPKVRAALQGIGLGMGLQIIGKVVTMGITKYGANNATVGKLYAPQISAGNAVAVAQAGQVLAPKTGAAGLPQGAHGFGACCVSGGTMCNNCQQAALRQYAPQSTTPPGGAPPTDYYSPPGEQLAPRVPGTPPGTPPHRHASQPRTPGVPKGTPPALAPQVPSNNLTPSAPPSTSFTAGVNGLGAAAETLRTHAATVKALRAHSAAFSAVDNGSATPAQRQTVDAVSRTHAVGIGALAQWDRSVLQAAIDTYGEHQLGLGDAPSPGVNPYSRLSEVA
jgi:hypothetical protein